MSLTVKQLERRQDHLGSTDLAAILGVSPYKSGYEVWAEKRGIVEPQPESDAMAIGTLLEPAIVDWAQDRLGERLTRNQYRSRPELYLGANIDAVIAGSGVPVEVKTAGLLGPLVGEWGDEGTDHVPDQYIVQCHVHMLTAKPEADECHLAAFLGGRGLRMYRVRRNDKLAAVIAETAAHFWERFVEAGVAPDEQRPSIDVLKRMRRQPGKVAKVAPSLVADYQAACEAVQEAESRKEAAQAALLSVETDAEAFDFGDAKKWYSYFETSRSTFDAKALRGDLPDVWQRYASTTRYRQLRLANKP